MLLPREISQAGSDPQGQEGSFRVPHAISIPANEKPRLARAGAWSELFIRELSRRVASPLRGDWRGAMRSTPARVPLLVPPRLSPVPAFAGENEKDRRI